jgi:N-acetylated-alpha-linked acidic dipeptidase
MEKYGDPGFEVHVAMGQFLGLLTYHLATDTIIPFNITTYSEKLQAYFSDLQDVINDSTCCKQSLCLSPLQSAIETFGSAADAITASHYQALNSKDEAAIQTINEKHKDFQRGFVSQGGLPNREFYKHVVFAPGVDTGYAATTFPGITEAVQAGNLTLGKEWVGKTSKAIEAAAKVLAV